MKKLLSLLCALTAALTVANSSVSAQTAKPQNEHALLYKISGKNLKKPSYLFGTIHIVCTPDMISMDKINPYLDQTDQLVLELDMDNAAEMQGMQKGLLIPNGKTLNSVLSAEQLTKVDELLKNVLGISVENVKTIRPVMLTVMLVTSPKVMGCNAPGSYEMSLLQAATATKKPIEGLETVESQFAALDSQPLEKQAKQLYEIALDPQKSFGDFKKLVEIYKTQNSEALYEIINSQMGDEREFQTRLLDTRNTAWIPKIEKVITEKPAFIAVGGGHLGGKNGVIRLLKARGYTVQAIKL